MADTGPPAVEGRPLLAFGQPATGGIPPRDAPPRIPRVRTPGPGRQGARLAPQFQALQDALAGQRAQLAESTDASDPELVVVFDLAGTVDGFLRACQGIDGLEFLADLQEDQVDADDDFFYEEESGQVSDDDVPQSLYMVMSNAQAVEELVRLFGLWQQDPSVRLDRGLNPLKQVFDLLRSVRRWEAEDRVRETGLLDDWREQVEVIGNAGRARVEIELWYRSEDVQRAEAQATVEQLIADAGGQVIRTSTIPAIQFHGVLADIPYGQVQAVLDDGPEAIDLLTTEAIMFVTSARPMTVSAPQPTEFGSVALDEQRPSRPPRVGLLDGLPLANHVALEGRLVIDDPDDRAAAYGTGQHGHGTAMAGLIAHGDLASPGSSLPGPIYVRPILQPHTYFKDVELVVPDELLVDLVHRALHRMFEGDGGQPPAAPSVRVVNLSIGDPARSFVRRLSPLAKLLDWLAHRYNIVVVVSAGNHGASPTVPVSALADPDQLRRAAARSHHASLRQRRLLSPAEAINAVTVGAQHSDASELPAVDSIVDVFEPDGPAGYSATGFGFRRSVKPEVLLPGGREVYSRPVATAGNATLDAAPVVAIGPGIKVAAPGLAGQLDGTSYTCGSSNAAALATRTVDNIYEVLDQLRAEEGDFDFPDPQYHPVLAKALLVHAARWGNLAATLRDHLELAPQRRRRELTQLLGYGPVDPAQVATAGRVRPVLVGAGSITKDQRQTFQFPLPPALSATTEWRRLVVTLAWLSPVNTRSQKHRMARLAVVIPRSTLAVEPIEADHNAVLKGTVQHVVLEGAAVVGFVAGSNLSLSVDCRVDAGTLGAPVRYGLVASLEVNTSVQADLHAQVRQGLRAQAAQRAQVPIR